MKDSLDYIVSCALAEDLAEDFGSAVSALLGGKAPPFEDITSSAICSNEHAEARIVAKDDGVLSGTRVVRRVFEALDPELDIEFWCDDGSEFSRNSDIACIIGRTRSILMGERASLNFLGHLSGIATTTRKFIRALEGTGITILDTRKTLPGLRMLEKEAVVHGGGKNHRMGLYDMVLIKDNHIDAAGSITEAVNRVHTTYGDRYRIEVETRTLEEVEEALQLHIDRIMLDNMERPMIQSALEIVRGKVEIEVSGNITLEKLEEIRDLDINYISAGSLTYAAGHTDFSLLMK